jgi:hypothetical protein
MPTLLDEFSATLILAFQIYGEFSIVANFVMLSLCNIEKNYQKSILHQ